MRRIGRTIDDPNRGANKARTGNAPMSLVKWGFIVLLGLPAAEVAAFLLIAALIGWLAAAALLVASSLVGVMLLRRSGGEVARFRAAFTAEGLRALQLESPGAATLVGGILLVFPGFITGLLGAGLLIPPLRRWAGARLAKARRDRRRRDDRVIDLAPGEWHDISNRGPRRKSKARRSRQGT
jgi:UPF0716 family protein affecting phage T7 exclusion